MGDSWKKKFFDKKNKGLGLNLWESILREGNMSDDDDDIDHPLNKGPTHEIDPEITEEDECCDDDDDLYEGDLPPWLDDDEDDDDDDDDDADFSHKKTKIMKKGNESVTNDSYASDGGKNDTYKKKGKKGGIRKDPPKPTK